MSVTAEGRSRRVGKARSGMVQLTVRVVGGAAMITVVAAVVLAVVVPKGGTLSSVPSAPVRAAELSFPRDSDGHYYVNAEINERRVRFVIDPALRVTVLSPDDARSAGVGGDDLKFTDRVVTASGETPAAPVSVRELRINTLTLFDAKLLVAGRPLPVSIAGRSFLDRFSGYELQPDKLVLRQ